LRIMVYSVDSWKTHLEDGTYKTLD
jgi:hypothetical protein